MKATSPLKVVARKPVAIKPTVKKTTTVVATVKPKAVASVSRSVAKPVPGAQTVTQKIAQKAAPKAVSPIMRDSFTMTTADQELLKKCKRDAIASGRDSTKKSEIVRAALRHFAALSASTRLMELSGLDPVKMGRPKKR